MNAIPVGAKGSFSMVVALEHLASRFKDPTLPPVLATPLMILFMENAALDAVREYLPPVNGRSGRHQRRPSANRLHGNRTR